MASGSNRLCVFTCDAATRQGTMLLLPYDALTEEQHDALNHEGEGGPEAHATGLVERLALYRRAAETRSVVTQGTKVFVPRIYKFDGIVKRKTEEVHVTQ